MAGQLLARFAEAAARLHDAATAVYALHLLAQQYGLPTLSSFAHQMHENLKSYALQLEAERGQYVKNNGKV
jgi:hypothetical protein